MEILTVELAVKEGREALASLNPHERLEAVQIISCYDGGGELVHAILLQALRDPQEAVRTEAYLGLGRMRLWVIEDLIELARGITMALELERDGSPAWFAGLKALEKLSLQAKELAR